MWVNLCSDFEDQHLEINIARTTLLVGLPSQSVIVSAYDPFPVARNASYAMVRVATVFTWLVAMPPIGQWMTTIGRSAHWSNAKLNHSERHDGD
jgi:hypothetical protein